MNPFLALAASGNALVACAHATCLIVGVPLFRRMGAPPEFIALVERGHWYPFVLTAAIAVVFCFAAYCAWAAPPRARLFLWTLTAACALRAAFFPWLKPYFPGNSDTFWYATSAFCQLMAICHGAGLWHTRHGGQP